MPYPKTLTDVANEYLEDIRTGVDELEKSAAEIETNPRDALDAERAAFHRAAAAGAKAYIPVLEGEIETSTGEVAVAIVHRAELVARTAHLAGWLSAGVLVSEDDRAAVKELRRTGFFEYHEAVPGMWVACYRLVAPA